MKADDKISIKLILTATEKYLKGLGISPRPLTMVDGKTRRVWRKSLTK